MNTPLPLVSIGIPTYNRPASLEIALQAVLQQSYRNLEIIVSDNCSLDETVQKIGLKYMSLDKRVRYIRQVINIQAEPNFNYVYRKAKGKYFMWMSDDDAFDPTYIEQCVEFLEENSDFIHASGAPRYFKNEKYIATEELSSFTASNRYLRLLRYLKEVRKNGTFYGVFRYQPQWQQPIGNHIGSDWCFVARLTLLGKIKILPNLFYTRSLEGGSANRESLLRRWQFKNLKKWFFEPYSAFIISTNIFDKKSFNFVRLFMITIIFVMLNVKFVINSLKKRLSPSYY